MMRIRLSIAALALICGAAHATAANLVVNGSFEWARSASEALPDGKQL